MAPTPDLPSATTGQHPPASRSGDRALPVLPDDAVLATIGRSTTRYPGSAFLDMLALRASGGSSDAAGLVARARSGDLDGTDGRDLAWFGYVLAAEPAGRASLEDVADLLDHAMATGADVGPRVRGLWLQLLLLTGRLRSGAPGPAESEVEPEEWWAVATDLLNPFGGDLPGEAPAGPGAVERWVASLSRPFTDAGLAPVRLREGPGEAFDRLTTDPVPAPAGQLVSVVMPVHDPGPSLLTSVRSVLAQSHADLEVLLCDDASTSGLDLIEQALALDPRVRLLRAPRNGGTYSARNLGLSAAQGRYVTFQDADDFSHPQRIERELAALAATPGGVAVVAHTLRATGSLLVAALGLRKVALNLSSLLVDRDLVVRTLGGFDTVRRSGDREFLGRLQATFGAGALTTMAEPLAICQLTPGSLSRGDMGFLRRHAARQAYAAAAGAWHREVEAGRERPHLVPPERAPFPAPDYIATGSASGDAGTVDVALLANPAANAPTDLGPLVQALCDAGLHVGVVEFLGPQDVCRQPQVPGDRLAALLRSGRARWVLPGERVRARLGVVHDAAAVLTMPAQRLGETHVDDLVVVVDGVGDLDVVAVRARAALAGPGRVHWLPSNEAVAQGLRDADPGASVLPAAPWLVAPGGAPVPAGRRSGVVGLAPARFGDREARTAWDRTFVPRDAATPVLGFGRGPGRRSGREVDRVGPPDVRWVDFLDRVDYLAVPPQDPPRLTRTVLDAWARGVVVLAPEALRPHLGRAAEYPGDLGADACLARHREDPETYRAVQRHATDWLRRHATPEGLLRTYDAVLRSVSEG